MALQYNYGDRTLFVADTKEEWRKLVKQGLIVYLKSEVALFESVPSLAKLNDYVVFIKTECPEAVVLGARDV